MDIIKELEAMRKRMIQEIDTEFNLLIERVSSEGLEPIDFTKRKEYESIYPLTVGSKLFKGKKPTNVILCNGTRIPVSTWKQVVHVIIEQCLKQEEYEKRLIELRDNNVSGKKRIFLSKTGENMRSPLSLSKDLYMETHYDTETLLNVLIFRILAPIQYDYSEIKISIRN